MAASDLTTILTAPGRLCINPSSLAAAFPHGGTALGTVRKVMLQAVTVQPEITAEEYGGEVIEKLYCGSTWKMACILRGLDADAVATVFPSAPSVGSTSRRTITHPGTLRAGTLRSDSSTDVVLLFSPDDTARHPAILFYRALPLIVETLEMAASMDEQLEIACGFVGIRDSSGRVMAMGLIGDLSL